MKWIHPRGFWLGLAAACAPAPAPRAPAAAATPAVATVAPSPPLASACVLPAAVPAPPDGVYPGLDPLPPLSVVLQYTDPAHRIPASGKPDVRPLPEAPLSAELSPLPLPTRRTIGAIGGTGPEDVWLVDENRQLFWYDGSVLRARGELCPKDGLYGPTHGSLSLVVRERELVLRGLLFTGTTPDPVVAVLPRPLTARCELRHAETFAAATEDNAVWTLDGDQLLGRSGAPLPVPQIGMAEDSPRPTALWLGSSRHAWLARGACPLRAGGCYSALWEYRGLGWLPRAPVDLAPVQLWVDDRDRVWLLGHDSDRTGSTAIAVLANGAWTRAALPSSFGEVRLVGRSASEVWFFDDRHLFVSDGAVTREVSTPLERIESLWLEPGGPVWIGGSERDGDEERGAVYRLTGVPQ